MIDDTPEKAKKAKTENILTKGIKFASEQDFLGFLNSRDKKSEKRKLKKSESKSSLATPKSSEQKPKSSEQKLKSLEQKPKSSEQTPKSSEQKPKSDQKFKVSKLKELFKNQEKPEQNVAKNGENEAKNPHKVKLQSAHFRHLNEKLYTQSGSNSLKMFQKDPKGNQTREKFVKLSLHPCDLSI